MENKPETSSGQYTSGPADLPDPPVHPAPPMGRGFWAAMALLGILVLMIVYAQIQGASSPATANLTGTSWTPTYYASGNGTMLTVPPGADMSLLFSPKNSTTLEGSSGCNWYSYHYSIRGSAFSLDRDSGSLTKMHCTAPGTMQRESDYLVDLENTASVMYRNNHLYLYDTAEKTILILEQNPA